MQEVEQKPVELNNVEPIYPYRAKRRGLEGFVKISFLVTTTGKVTNLTVLEAQPPGLFDQSVRQIVRHWRFNPGVKDGRAVDTLMTTTIRFKLEDSE